MASILSGHTGALPVVPSGRIAAGRSVGMNIFRTPYRGLRIHAPGADRHWPAHDMRFASIKNPNEKCFRSKPRAKTRATGARMQLLTTNVVLLEQRLVARLVLL
ncbi:hypothetical protein, partial [Bradyrhizobium guangdongense]|uniref:hypothetical protein n=1 Tax=Bradyrhizobium guangdongense TaxID=1325090 RepID=UPI001AED56D6